MITLCLVNPLNTVLASDDNPNTALKIREFRPELIKEEQAEDDHYQIDIKVDYQLTEHLRKAIQNGITLHSDLTISLIQNSNWWFDKHTEVADVRYSLRYHKLSQKYIVTALQTEKQWSYFSLNRALDKMSLIEQLKIPPLVKEIPDGDYALFAQIKLQLESTTLPLNIQSWFSKKGTLESEGILWPLP